MNRERRFASLVEKDSGSLVEKDSESLVEKDADCLAGERETGGGGASSVRVHLLSAPGTTCVHP